MTDPEQTQPPRKPRTPRVFIAAALAWSREHPVWTAWICGPIVGFVLGKVV